ncbi:hypothetical protein [Streptomyces sp. NPDC002328]|uniref:hypothetical protein n=1 Tax=Streptomyces sp. NPDC002328 TaxID=3364642 RepID=UPI0036B03ED5
MTDRPAHLRSPVALLTCCALLCATLAGILALAGRAEAATQLGGFTLAPATGKITDDPVATSVTTSAGCPEAATGNLKVYSPSNPDLQTAIAQSTVAVATGTAPVTVPLKSLPLAKKSLEKALRVYLPAPAPLDGTYTLGLGCGGGTTAPVFLAKVRVTGDTWTLIEQQATTVGLTVAPEKVAIKEALKLTATVSPATAAGAVEFKQGNTSLGTAQVTGGKAELAVTAPAIGGQTAYDAVFTAADPDAYGNARATKEVSVSHLVSAKDAAGKPLAAKPTLYVGQTVKITVQGFTPNAKVVFADKELTADATGTLADFAYTVPNGTINGEQTLRFLEGGSNARAAVFTFVSSDQEPSPSPEPSEGEDLDVTDEDGKALDDDPRLEPGRTVKITARGYTKDATVKVALADSEEKFADAKAGSDGTVKDYAFTVPEKIADGDHVLTLAEDKTGGHSVQFAFTTGDEASGSPEPSPSDSAGGTGGAGGASGTGGGGSGGSGGGTGGGAGTGGTSPTGSMAATGAQVGAIGLTALAFVAGGAALVLHMRRRGLLAFGDDSPQHR